MKRLILLITIIISLGGCSKSIDATLTCNYDDNTIVYTFNNKLVSVYLNEEESGNADFWNGVIDDSYEGDMQLFFDDMVRWYTETGFFNDAVCVYK